MTTERATRRKQRVGTVVSDKMDKSIVVNFAWASRHPIYRKARRRMTRFVAHDEHNEATLGDIVLIEETRPLSKTKRWRLVRIVTAVDVAEIQPAELDPEAGALPARQVPPPPEAPRASAAEEPAEEEAAIIDEPEAEVEAEEEPESKPEAEEDAEPETEAEEEPKPEPEAEEESEPDTDVEEKSADDEKDAKE